ncbi:MAG: dynamin family protein [Paraclostridium sp.]|uniref:dynamin family protein n=1 Tax=Paraclostridium sp. TaxID=2023273 RepID=UPI003F38A802
MKNLNNYTEEIKYVFIESPIRNYLLNEISIPFKKVIQYNLEDVMNNLEILLEKPISPFKIAIIGEVKSGKSTLVNSIVGKEISEVDVLEATSTIINVYYSEESNLKVDKECINIGVNSDFLKNINLVDTPGLKSITTNNESKTMKYIQNTDFILFVFDSTHIGQEDIKDSLELIHSYGKPIVGVLNKCDLLECEYEETLSYAREEYGLYIEEFFLISSYLEYQNSISKKATAKLTDIIIEYPVNLSNNYNKLIELLSNISINTDNIKLESIIASVDALKHKEKIYHYEYLKSLEMIESEMISHKNLLKNKYDYIEAKMEFEINEWINKKFLVEEISRINKSVEIANDYINESYINNIINDKKMELDELFFYEWDECIKEVNEISNKNIKKFVNNINYIDCEIDLPKVKLSEEDININEMLATIGTGAILGATSGSAVAMYAAALGTSAHSLTIGTAMLTYCPPLLLAGTLTGGIGKIAYDKLKREQINKDILIDIEEFKESIKDDIKNMLIGTYIKASDEIIKINQGIFESSKEIYLNEYEIESLKEKLKLYIDELK